MGKLPLSCSCCMFLFMFPLFADATRQSAVFTAAVTRQSAVTAETEAERLARREIEADNILAKVNRPYVKSFKSSYGDIIDCVRIEDQITFYHPLMKNHTIRMRPTWEPEYEPEMLVGVGDEVHEILHHPNDGEACPNGTVPVRRTLKENVLNFDPIERYGRKDPSYGLWLDLIDDEIDKRRQARMNHHL